MAALAHHSGPAPHLTLLAVGGGEGELEASLRDHLPSLALTHARTASEAAALLRKIQYDLVLVEHELEDGTSFDLLDALADLDLRVPVVVRLPRGARAEAVEVLKAGAQDVLFRGDAQSERALPVAMLEAMRRHQRERQREERLCEEQQRQLLESVRGMVARVSHEVNNPLAIISGNAQLLMELARALDLDEEIGQPIQDIEEATRRLSASLAALNDLREDLRTSPASSPPRREGGTPAGTVS